MLAIWLGALCLALTGGSAWLLGRLLLPADLRRGGAGELALGGLLGLAAIATLDFAFRLCGYRLPPLAVLVLVGAAAAVAFAQRGRRPQSTAEGATAMAGSAIARLVLVLLVAGLPFLLLALYPSVDPDPGAYHLPYARGFIEQTGLPFFSSLRFPVFPQLSEILFSFGVRLDGDAGAHLIEVAAALFTALLLWVWGREIAGEPAGLVAAALWLGNPLVILLGTTAHVDVGLAAFVIAGFYCLERARQDERAAWPVLAGLLLGAAAAVKYLGLFFVAAGAISLVWRRKFALRFAAAALAVALPVYGHILWTTGSPLFPFFPEVFGYTEWTPELSLRPEQVQPIPVPWTGATVKALLRFPASRGEALLHLGARTLQLLELADRDPPHIRVLRRMPSWGRTAVFLLLAAAVVRGLVRPSLRLVLGTALASVLLWLATQEDMQRLDPRYLLAAAPPVALAGGAFVADFVSFVVRTVERRIVNAAPLAGRAIAVVLLIAVLSAAVVPGLAYALARSRWLGPFPGDRAGIEAVRRARVTGFAALQEAARRHGANSTIYGLYLSSLAYLAPGRYLGEWYGPDRYAKLDTASGDALFRSLEQRGADHFLVPRAAVASLPHDQGFIAHFRLEYEDDETVLWELAPLSPALAVPSRPAG